MSGVIMIQGLISFPRLIPIKAEGKVFVNMHILDVYLVSIVTVIRDPKFIQNDLVTTSKLLFPLSKGGKRESADVWAILCRFPFLDSQVTGTSLCWASFLGQLIRV